MDTLVYDRTQADSLRVLQYINNSYSNLTSQEKEEWDSYASKGSWNYTDANRVSTWIAYLKKLCISSGIDTSDIPDLSASWAKNSKLYVEDVQQLQECVISFCNKVDIDTSVQLLTADKAFEYTQANAIEKDLQLVYNQLMAQYTWPICGEAVCGGDYL